jgi:hypothetical protein
VTSADAVFAALEIPPSTTSLPGSEKRFPDGGQYRIEIPSTEGPGCLRAVIDEAAVLGVPVHRVSQGSGVFLLSDAELRTMAHLGADARIEVSLFARPTADWDASAMVRSPGGALIASSARGVAQLRAALADIHRAAQFGFRSVLISDLGVLDVFAEARRQGYVPPEMRAKISVLLAASNPAAVRVLARMGANSVNVTTDLSLQELSWLRAAVDIPLDIYVEVPDSLGGFSRMHEIPEIIRVAAPVYLKFGVRNARDLYPSGRHLESTALDLSRERIRRALLGLEMIDRSGYELTRSEAGAPDLAVPIEA